MDFNSSARHLESLKREEHIKKRWQQKYLPPDQIPKEPTPSDGTGKGARGMVFPGHEIEPEAQPATDSDGNPILPEHEKRRQAIRDEVASTRPISHRLTKNLTTENLLKDIGPSLWASVNYGAQL